MKYTAKCGLKKPDYTDKADINDLNDNADIVDDRVAILEHMTIQNDYYAPLLDDDGCPLLDDDGYAILRDWKYAYA